MAFKNTLLYVVNKKLTSNITWVGRKQNDRKGYTIQTLIYKTRSGYINIRQSRLRIKQNYRDKEEYYIVIKESIHHEDIAILNVYASNNRASKHMK